MKANGQNEQRGSERSLEIGYQSRSFLTTTNSSPLPKNLFSCVSKPQCAQSAQSVLNDSLLKRANLIEMHSFNTFKKHLKEMGELRNEKRCETLTNKCGICMQVGGWMFPLH